MSPTPLLWAAFACGPSALPVAEPAPAELRAWVDQGKVGSGESVQLHVRTRTEPQWQVELAAPVAEGLTPTLSAHLGPDADGQAQVQTWSWSLSGPDGSYIIAPGGGTATGPAGATRPLELPPIFVDIGVPGPSGGKLADLASIPPAQPVPWAWIGGGALLALGLAVGGWMWWRSRRAPPPLPEPDPPDVAALKAWELARSRLHDDHALAMELSRIFRAYLEDILAWPASARTSREILSWLEAETRLGPADRVRASHVLNATDRLKFARQGGGESFFDELGSDFVAVIDATRPRPAAAVPPGEAPHV